MADKDLKKLSKLEILELLLEQTKEKETLKEELSKLKKETERQDRLLELENTVKEMSVIVKRTFEKQNTYTDFYAPDKDIYCRLLIFLVADENNFALLPEDLQRDIKLRIRGVLDGEQKF